MEEIFDKIFKSRGIKDYDDLHDFEKEEYQRLVKIADATQLTLESFRKEVAVMREKVEFSIAVDNLTKEQDLYLKARLKNLILFEGILNRPERAKDMLEMYSRNKGA